MIVIFDLDGTLLYTIKDLAFCGNHILHAHGYPEHPTEAYNYFVGDGIRKLVERMLPENARTNAIITPLFEEYLQFYAIHKMDTTRPYDGIVELLESLQEQGIKTAVASNKAHEAMDDLMKHYFPTIRFAAAIGNKKGARPKPAPDVVFDILQIAGETPENAFYVGDTATDMLTARNAGIDQSIGVLWGFRDEAELVRGGAKFIVREPSELLTLIVG